jgi:hypothetical protein
VTLRDCFKKTRFVAVHPDPTPVERTVAEAIVGELAPQAILTIGPPSSGVPSGPRLQVGVAPPRSGPERDAMFFRFDASGSGEMTASHGRWIYALKCLVCEDWVDREEREFFAGVHVHPSYPWLRNLSDFFVGSLRGARHFDREAYVRQIARQGFSHITINGLGVDRPFESGPPGDVYSWFYDYSPDLDQFVDSVLLRGYYPADYLQANLNFLKANAALAVRYGLTPGLHINSPRSMPEEFWHRYGFLRGARVDHPRESLRPRYTLAMAHPAVQQHYRELIRAVMKEVPEIGFVHVWTNDSGSGFEFVSSLYAGRNGGPYLIREWKSGEEIARKAGENVLTYYRLLRDEGRAVNPEFRLVCDLGPFSAEIKHIVQGLGNGIDAGEFAFFEKNTSGEEKEALSRSGAVVHQKLDLTDNTLPGLPFPRLVYDRLTQIGESGSKAVLTSASPGSLASYDINGEVIRAVQLNRQASLEQTLNRAATRWAGETFSNRLMEIWNLSDTAVRSFPAGVPMSTFAFPWFRLWIRPFVPDIDAIPEEERLYYERFLLATFNNPARIDLNNDMLWNFLTVQEAAEKKRQIEELVLRPLATAIGLCRETLEKVSSDHFHAGVFRDLLDRLRAARCFYATMRNSMAWTESVHGYCDATTSGEKERYRILCREMVESELGNARELLLLWRESRIDFTPVSGKGESLHIYGGNFGDHLERRIALMELHRDDEPMIDPDYMWRFPMSPQRAAEKSKTT